MDATRFGLRHRPFRPTPDTAFYYPATIHELALAQMTQAIADDEGFILLTGDVGTGKTLLCHNLVERIGSEATCAFLTNSHFRDRVGLLQAILYDLALPFETKSEQELRLSLTDHLLQQCGQGRKLLLIIDEAQHLTTDLLEELRLLGNLETRTSKAIQVVLVALPEFLTTLARPQCSALSQRLVVRARLEPLDFHEGVDYLCHQLRIAGGQPDKIIMDEALTLLARGAKGVPRLLNQSASQALNLAQANGLTAVDAEVALEALDLLGLEVPPEEEAASADENGDLAAEPVVNLHADQGEVFCGDDGEQRECPGQEAQAPAATRSGQLFSPPRRSA